MSKRGRPAAPPTPEERQKVKDMVADNVPVADIGRILGRSEPTLRKYFLRELLSRKKIIPAAKSAFVPTAIHRQKVELYEGFGMSREQIALYIGCTGEELESLFPDELKVGKAKARARVIDALVENLDDGNAPAVSKALELTADPVAGATGPNGYVSKKGAALAAAAAAGAPGGKFATRAPPKLIVNNSK